MSLELWLFSSVTFLVGFFLGRYRSKYARDLALAAEAASAAVHAASGDVLSFAELTYERATEAAIRAGRSSGVRTSWLELSQEQREAVVLLTSGASEVIVDEARARREILEERAKRSWLRSITRIRSAIGQIVRARHP